MSLYKRDGSAFWWTHFTVGGQRVRKSTETADRRQAEQYEARLKARLWEEAKLGSKPKRLWQEAVVRWLREKALEGKKSLDDDRAHLRWLDPHLRGLTLDQINRDVIDRLVTLRREPREIRRLRGTVEVVAPQPATINRMLAVLRAILRRAERDWEWLTKAPAVRLLPEPKRRVRWLRPEEAARLLAELPEHQRDVMLFELETGLRQGNVRGLKWSQVDMARQCAWIHAEEAKGGVAIPVPLTRQAIAVMERQIGKHPDYVFTYQGRPIGQLNTRAWQQALQRAGIANFRWHDLRHTWASWHAQSGTPQHVLQELGGWQSPEMVRRYAHLSGESLLAHAERRNERMTAVTQS